MASSRTPTMPPPTVGLGAFNLTEPKVRRQEHKFHSGPLRVMVERELFHLHPGYTFAKLSAKALWDAAQKLLGTLRLSLCGFDSLSPCISLPPSLCPSLSFSLISLYLCSWTVWSPSERTDAVAAEVTSVPPWSSQLYLTWVAASSECWGSLKSEGQREGCG